MKRTRTSITNEIIERVQELSKKNITITEIASRTCVCSATVSRILNGHYDGRFKEEKKEQTAVNLSEVETDELVAELRRRIGTIQKTINEAMYMKGGTEE